MKQINSAKRHRSNEDEDEIIIEVQRGFGVFTTAIIGFATAGAVEGMIAYALLKALNEAEVWEVSPRPLFMISVGIAWRFLRGIDQAMKP